MWREQLKTWAWRSRIEGRRKKEDGRRKMEEGRKKREKVFSNSQFLIVSLKS
ncbi:MAG: hypothetical protein ABI262_10855 [Microcoleus sp.]